MTGVAPGEERGQPRRRRGYGCPRHPAKRVYRTMRAATWAADVMRRRQVDAHLVDVFECGTHLHAGHRTEDQPAQPRWRPPPLTHRPQLPPHLAALGGHPDPGDNAGALPDPIHPEQP